MNGMMAEFPNDWEEVHETPVHRFVQTPAEVVLSAASSWDLPTNIDSIIRWECESTGRIQEKVYRSQKAAHKKVTALAKTGQTFIVMNQQTMEHSNYI